MAVTTTVFDNFKLKAINLANTIDFDVDTIKIMLTTSTYTPAQATHDFKDDVTNEVANGGGYTTGGVTLSGGTVALDAGGFAYYDANDVTWTAATFTCRRGVLYKDTGTASTSPLIGWIDFGADQVNSGGDFKIVWAAPASGAVVKLT